MNVGLITTWNEKCGIAEYSKNLAESLTKLGIRVIIYPTSLVWDLKVFSDLKNDDVLNFQYEHGLFSQDELREWLTRFHSSIIHPKLFVTVHQILKDDIWPSLRDFLNGVVLHSEHFGPILKDKTYVIPHGCPVCEPLGKQEARKKLGLRNYETILSTFGFMFAHKHWEYLIGAMPKIQRVFPKCILLMICSHFRDKSKTEPTAKSMKAYAKKVGANVKFFHDKWEIREFMPLIQASDIFLTSQETEDRMIISGSAMMGVSARRPTITNDCTIYNQIKPYSLVVDRGKPEKIAEAVIELLSSEPLYSEYLEQAQKAYSEFNWDTIARKHISLYRSHL